MAFKSVLDDFKKIKTAMKEEKESGKKGSYNNPLIFKPVAVKDEEKTKFRIRFLPVQESKIGKPWVEAKYHMFERDGDNKYFKVLDPRTFSKDAKNPIAEFASKLWNSDNALDKEKAKKYFTKKRYFTLVYVKEAPENQKDYVGKVLVFEVGQKIYNQLETAINDYEMCFWDPFKGKDFMLVVKQTGEDKWPDYSMSNWIGNEGPIASEDEEMERISKELETITIKSVVFEKEGIKSAKELEDILYGGVKAVGASQSEGENLSESEGEEQPAKPVAKPAAKPTAKPAAKPDFGDDNVAAKPTAKQEQKKQEEAKEEKDESMEFDVDLSDLDVKF